TCIDGSVYDYQGLRIFGLGGSYRYRSGEDMYTERQMRRRIWKASGKLFLSGGFDILLTHAAAYGYGDLQDLPHRGFDCFNDLMEQYKPSYMFHGHVHKEYGHFERELIHESGTRIINCYGHVIKEVNTGSGKFTRAFPGKLKRL
ncbi:MAG: metallophosphoesterase, partial [Solobacterium sp.]|nr:metallophosphoesterase [Solobacterium sp.]